MSTLPALREPAERGSTTLADKVIERIAARAALDVQQASGLSRKVVGRELGSSHVRASVQVDGRIAALELELAVEYPAPVRDVTRQVRRHVGERVSMLCDLTVDHIDITVALLRRHPRAAALAASHVSDPTTASFDRNDHTSRRSG